MRSEREKAVTRTCLVVSAALIVTCVVLRLLFAKAGISPFPAYRVFTKGLFGCLAALMSAVPFAMWDLGIACLFVAWLVWLVVRVRSKRSLLPAGAIACLVVSINVFLFVVWAFNHYAPPLCDDLGLEVGEYSTDELEEAAEHYLREAATLATKVPRTHDGNLAEQDFFELADIAGASYEGLGETYPVFRGSAVPVKALVVWGEPLLYTGHTGMFWAPTGESGVPLNCAPADLPYTMCHEAAHRLGIASEQEANFAAFLACQAHDDVRLSYSGYYNAFAYCLNALYRANPDRVQPLLQRVADDGLYQGVIYVLSDRQATAEHYRAYEGPVEEVGAAVNDTYLKSFGESEGVRSYGLVVDYLIAWYQAAA